MKRTMMRTRSDDVSRYHSSLCQKRCYQIEACFYGLRPQFSILVLRNCPKTGTTKNSTGSLFFIGSCTAYRSKSLTAKGTHTPFT